jgi:hypothetical protein
MGDICLFVSTEQFDPVSAIIREKTCCAWSHVGFYRISDNMTFSAMCDGSGVAWRPKKAHQEVLLLDAPGVDAAFQKALTQIGKPYDLLDIGGLATGYNWYSPNHFICSVLVLWSFETGKLLNTAFIPQIHLTPRDILLSLLVSLRK